MWDFYQEGRLNDQRARQSELASQQSSSRAELQSLKRQVTKVSLVSQALYELVKEETGITDERLRRKISEVDLRDGSEDGELKACPLRCPKCQNTMTAGALFCQFCGAKVAPKYPFEE